MGFHGHKAMVLLGVVGASSCSPRIETLAYAVGMGVARDPQEAVQIALELAPRCLSPGTISVTAGKRL